MVETQQPQPESSVQFESVAKKIHSLPLYQDRIKQLLSRTIWNQNETAKRKDETATLIKLLKERAGKISSLQENILLKLGTIEKTLSQLLKKSETEQEEIELEAEIPITAEYAIQLTVKKDALVTQFATKLTSKTQNRDEFIQRIREHPKRMKSGELVTRKTTISKDDRLVIFSSEIFSRKSENENNWQGVATLFMMINHRLNRVALDVFRTNRQVSYAKIIDHSQNGWSARRAQEIGFINGLPRAFTENSNKEKVYASNSDQSLLYTIRKNEDSTNTYTYFY